ncbi:MAG: polyamine aminopropyltransferase [Thermoplasmataceae archaeon]
MKLIENWFSERYSDNLQLSFRVMDQLLSVKTDFQRIDLFETYDFGKLLSIDGTVQITEKDEFVYHEMITSVPYYIINERPKNALIVGGGDGGAAGELLKLGLERITNVEIDSQVVEVSKKFFPKLASSFLDKRVNLIIGDGADYLKNTREKFDIIIVDSTDPVGPAEVLFHEDFYRTVKDALTPHGVMVTQSGSPFYQPEGLKLAWNGLKKVFKHVSVYTAFIPTYPSGFWSFTLGSDTAMSGRTDKVKSGRYFNSEILKGSFSLPQFVKDLLS